MSFGNIDNQKSDFALVLLVQFVEGRNLPPEWRSSVAAEHHYHWFNMVESRQLNGSAPVKFG
jgi:hypothetical protein